MRRGVRAGVNNFPKRATLAEIRKVDGAQRYECEDGDVQWLTGISINKNARIGDTGSLVYRKGPSYGLIFFENGVTCG